MKKKYRNITVDGVEYGYVVKYDIGELRLYQNNKYITTLKIHTKEMIPGQVWEDERWPSVVVRTIQNFNQTKLLKLC